MEENSGKVSTLDLKSIDLKVGLEVHQQLATPTKLFCSCPPFSEESSEDTDLTKSPKFMRILRPASSELGEFDIAAQFESRKEIVVNYLAPVSSSCLVESDEEPPHPISEEALETSLIFALALSSRVIDEIHVMRKIVVDGSNTSGFQRTAVVALGGQLKYGKGKSIGVQTISVEEDAARAVKAEWAGPGDRTYALDRLGSPLVEVALAPMEGSPEDAEEAAMTLGQLMRSTGRVARGLGTIRQDLNISVMGGNVIEVKGVQRLDQFRKVITYEAARQKFFFDLAKEIRQRAGKDLTVSKFDATEIFKNSSSKILKRSLSEESSNVVCIVVRDFAGFIGRENEFHARLGKELGAIAKSYGLGGVFHSDELPNYGITPEEVSNLRRSFSLRPEEAFVLVAGLSQRTNVVADALITRLRASTSGVPTETRAASIDGETTFLRPRPGSARMYPETDIPLIEVSEATLGRLRDKIPEPWEKLVRDFSSKYNLPLQLGEPLFDSDRKALFEEVIAETGLPATIVASTLVETFLALSRSGVEVDSIRDESLLQMFEALRESKFAKEAVPDILREISASPHASFDEILKKTGFGKLTREELQKIIDEVITQNSDIIASKGTEGVHSTLMGKVMQRVRGKVDGKEVNKALSASLNSLNKNKR